MLKSNQKAKIEQLSKFLVIFRFEREILGSLAAFTSAISESVDHTQNPPSFPLLCQLLKSS